MKDRAEIDGLRAVAVIPVVFFHAGVSIFPGGFIGVNIFAADKDRTKSPVLRRI